MAGPEPADSGSREASLARGVYATLLGADLGRVPEPLRAFHGAVHGGTARGTLAVERAPGRLAGWVATLLGLPRATPGAAVVLTVTVHGERERWIRTFDGRPLVSWQRAYADLLLERFGPYTFGFRVVVEPDGLWYTFARAWFLGVPLPRWLAVTSTARTRAQGAGWLVESVVAAPLVGRLVRYKGVVSPP